VKTVFAAALPLVQAKPTVAAVEALLLAVLRLDPDNKGIGDKELRMQAMEVIVGLRGRGCRPSCRRWACLREGRQPQHTPRYLGLHQHYHLQVHPWQ
jgi:hypothetical protein